MNIPFRCHQLSVGLLAILGLLVVFSTGCSKEEPQAAAVVEAPAAKDEAPAAAAPPPGEPVVQAPAAEVSPEAPPAPPAVAAVAPAAPVLPAPTVNAAPAAKTVKDLLIGKWQLNEGGAAMTFEFKTDGTLSMSVVAGEHSASMTGSYSWTSDSVLSVTMTENGEAHTEQATIKSIDATSMTITSPTHDKDITLTRAAG